MYSWKINSGGTTPESIEKKIVKDPHKADETGIEGIIDDDKEISKP